MKVHFKQLISIHSMRFVLGCIFAAVSVVINLAVYNNLKAGLLFAVLFLLSGAVKIPNLTIPQKSLSILYALWFVLSTFVTLALSQFCLNERLPQKGIIVTGLGVLLILFLFLLPLIITLRIRCTTIIVSAVLIVFSCINHFVFVYRGSEVVPADILSIGTAGNVAAEYSFYIPAPMFYALTLSVFYFFSSFLLPSFQIKAKRKTRVFCGGIATVCATIVCIGVLNVQPLHWLKSGSVRNGVLLNFTVSIKESFAQKPTKYNVEEVNRIAEKFALNEINDSRTPDIIVVMNESFANLGILGNKLSTNTEITPYIDSLRENILSGYTFSSVFGGGTPNSEFEFLTGNTCLFLPTGSIAYQQFIKSPINSVASELKNRGYSTTALHQYLSSSWMRERIWPLLGFDECLFLEDFPQKDFLRNWGTDQEMFEKIVSVYEEKKATSNSPVFVFSVTIQNHGGYDYSEDDFIPLVKLQGYSKPYLDVEQYLTCIHETDRAVEWLIEYFKQNDHDVVILFYGDHFPQLSNSFFEEVHGSKFETLDEQMLQYEVPFFIWTNYDSKTEKIELTSMNYLAGLLYKKAELELPPYNQFLEKIRETIPACNSFGFFSKSANAFLTLEDATGEEKQALLEYNNLEWNSLFDEKNRSRIFFPLTG